MSDTFTDFMNVIHNTCHNVKVKAVVKHGAGALKSLQPFFKKPNFWNGLTAAMNIGSALLDAAETWSGAYFENHHCNWVTPYSMDLSSLIIRSLSKYPTMTLKTVDQNVTVKIAIVDGVKVGWTYQMHSRINSRVYVETKKFDESKQVIKQLLWKQFGSDSLILRRVENAHEDDDCLTTFELDKTYIALPSAKATEYAVYLKRCVDAGVNRSVMLYGPPGTGKSTMAKTLVETLKMRSLRIRVADVGVLDTTVIFEAIDVFQPDAIILDDFDRSNNQNTLLEKLEFFQQRVKLVIATVNDCNQLDEAILRPGRFDELVLVDRMDDAVIKHILGEFIDGFEEVKTWPIAFIQEYVKRRHYMSTDEVIKSMFELSERVKRLDKYRQAQVWDSFNEKEREEGVEE